MKTVDFIIVTKLLLKQFLVNDLKRHSRSIKLKDYYKQANLEMLLLNGVFILCRYFAATPEQFKKIIVSTDDEGWD